MVVFKNHNRQASAFTTFLGNIHCLINYLRFVEDMNDTRDKKMIAIIDNFSVIYILGGVS
jgi:hypothetical protein